MFSKKFLSGAALTALSVAMGGQAFAQSTASQEEEVIVVTGQRGGIEGIMTAEQSAKARATITSEFIDQQAAGQSILQTINLVPGVSFANSDNYGSSGGNLTIRGFDGARISLTFDGIPLNDTGNYAIFSNQQLDPELIGRANVNMGTTDVDSPTASATGGTVNYITRLPDEEMGVELTGTMGDFNYNRIFGLIDSGEFGPWGTTAYLAASRQEYDQFIGPGSLDKTQYNGRIYQPLGGRDFISASFHYNENRNAFYRTISLAQYNSGFVPYNDATCNRTTPGAGAQDESLAAFSCTNFYGVRINPSDTGNIRGQSRFSLGENLVFTLDPSIQYVRANGGGIENVRETDIRLRRNFAGSAVDLNGDGDTLDRINLYSPSNTNTYRYGFTSSLIWDISDTQRIRFGYTWDYGRHRQTGEYSQLQANGHPEEVFGGKDGFGEAVNTFGGGIFQKRNRFSIASLSQLSAEYRGDFFEDAVTLTVGVRAPVFTRELNQNCYSVKGSTSSTQFCTAFATVASPVSPGFVRFDVNNDGDALDNINVPGVAVFNEAATDYAPPFQAEVEYEDVLPSVGLTWRPAEGHQVFLSYAQGLSAPRTDDLYGGILGTQLDDVQPETSTAYDLGYRYQGAGLMASTTVWYNQFENRIIRSQDPLDPTVSFARNVGAVDLWGWDGQVGFNASEDWTMYFSAAYTMSELKNNLPGQVVGAGNQLPETPEWTYAARSEYTMGPVMFGVQAKFVDERFSNDFNTESAQNYMVVDTDIRLDLPEFWGVERSYLQLNVTNVMDEDYLSTISPGANGGTGFYGIGGPRTATLTLRTEF
jgi:iron complex outermembrane receptor protein